MCLRQLCFGPKQHPVPHLEYRVDPASVEFRFALRLRRAHDVRAVAGFTPCYQIEMKSSCYTFRLEYKGRVRVPGLGPRACGEAAARGWGNAQAVMARGTGNNEWLSATVRATASGTLKPSFALPVTLRSTLRLARVCTGCRGSSVSGLEFSLSSCQCTKTTATTRRPALRRPALRRATLMEWRVAGPISSRSLDSEVCLGKCSERCVVAIFVPNRPGPARAGR
jgi:hypothetical protein